MRPFTPASAFAPAFTPETNALVFAAAAHGAMHMFAAYFFTIVLALERVWDLPYPDLIALWTPAALLIGVAAIPMGWLADRWTRGGMIAVSFVGMGAASIVAGFMDGPSSMVLALAAVGLFAAIYHPVGIPWVMRLARRNPGKGLAVNGLFGGMGVAFAALTAGTLIDFVDWRAAFFVPGAVSLAVGVLMFALIARGRIAEPGNMRADGDPGPGRAGMLRGAFLILGTGFVGGLVYQSTQAVMPKMFEARLDDLLGGSTFGIGAVVFAVYILAGLGQLVGGWAADRWDWKRAYLLAWVVHMPMLWFAATAGGPFLVFAVFMITMAGTSAIPAEALLFARYTPERHHGLIFGVRYVLALGSAPLAIQFIALVLERTGEFAWIYWTLGVAGCLTLVGIALLPPTERIAAPDVPD
ncbi:MAG: MFS transporter, partial [Alphaproteobacteria bacterium]|nr:MFS transporter [Alphaproteobacteria bacterium]